jgi:hypothetical protein
MAVVRTERNMRRPFKANLFLAVMIAGIIVWFSFRYLRSIESEYALDVAGWGKSSMRQTSITYPNRCAQALHLFNRLWFVHSGITLPRAASVSLNTVMRLYHLSLVPTPESFTVFYSPRLDGARVQIVPVTRTNQGQITVVRLPLRAILASNGLNVAFISRNVVKIFPSDHGELYEKRPAEHNALQNR